MFKLDECPACGCQELVYKSGTNKIGHWEGYKCQNKDCAVMTFNKTPKGGAAPKSQNGASPDRSKTVKDIAEIKSMVEEIYSWVKKQKGEIPVTPGELEADEDIPF